MSPHSHKHDTDTPIAADEDDELAEFNRILHRAHDDAMKELKRADATNVPGDITINSLDGRKKFVRRFKNVSDKVRHHEYRHPDLPLRLAYDRRGDGYYIENLAIEAQAEDNSMMQKHAGYTALHERLKRNAYAREGNVGPK